jgi:hypothetical protein
MCIHLSNYGASRSFHDAYWANRIIIFSLRSLLRQWGQRRGRSLCKNGTNCTSKSKRGITWNRAKPSTYDALYTSSSSTADENGGSNPFPLMLMLDAPHVLGMQYFYFSKIVLKVYNPRLASMGFEAFCARRQADVRDHANFLFLCYLHVLMLMTTYRKTSRNAFD